MSANTGSAPTRRTALADAAKENDGTITSSPAPMPSAIKARCKAEVPELTATQCRPPTTSENSASKAATSGPWTTFPLLEDADSRIDVGLVDDWLGQGDIWRRRQCHGFGIP